MTDQRKTIEQMAAMSPAQLLADHDADIEPGDFYTLEYGELLAEALRKALATPSVSLLQQGAAKDGASLIATERLEQVVKHGWDLSHDADYARGELMQAAATCLSLYSGPGMRSVWVGGEPTTRKMWPWQSNYGMRLYTKIAGKDKVGQLKVAGALIAAEIDRLQGTQPAALSQYQQERGGASQWHLFADEAPVLEAVVLAMHHADPAPIAAVVKEDHMGHRYLVDTGYGQGYEFEEFSHWQPIVRPGATPTPVAIEEGGGWISVEERLPETQDDYSERLQCYGDGGIDGPQFVAYYSASLSMWFLAHDNQPVMQVTHWQPLPTAPAKKEAPNG